MTVQRKFKVLVAALVAAMALSATLATAQAQPYPRHDRGWNCHEQIQRAEDRLDRAIRRHGQHSHATRERRHELRDIRERCRSRRDRDRYHHY